MNKSLYTFYCFVRREWMKVWCFGFRLKCNLCGYHGRKFLPGGVDSPANRKIIGGGFRENVYCPSCYGTDKERLMYEVLKAYSAFDGTKSILHFAPEKRLRSWLEGKEGYISGDIVKGRAMMELDIRSLPFPDRSFDLIICSHVLEHIVEDRQAMNELARVCEGIAILQVPFNPDDETFEDASITSEKERELAFGQKDHVRIYGNDYVDRLKKAGFKVEVQSAYDFVNDPIYFGINSKEPVFIAYSNI